MTEGYYYESFEPKWLCLFVIDVSASMGEESLDKFNKELYDFQRLVSEDGTLKESLEVSIITFAQDFIVLQEPSFVESFTMPLLNTNNIDAMTRALNNAVEKIDNRKMWYKLTGQSFYKPCLILVTSKPFDKLFQNSFFNQIRLDIKAGKYELLNYCTNEKSIFYEKYGSSIIKGKDNIFQAMHYIHNFDLYR